MRRHLASAMNRIEVGLVSAAVSACALADPRFVPARDDADRGTVEHGVPAEQTTARYHYSYFKELIPLTLDAGRVAIRCSAADGSIAAALEACGIAAAEISPGPIGGWSFVNVSCAAPGDEDLQRLVRRLAAEANRVEFTSPVFQDEYGSVVITPDLLVGFHADVSHEDADAILASAAAGTITDVNYARLDNVYRIRSDSRDGFRVLETANALARHPRVIFAEPDAIRTAKLWGIPNDPLFPRQWALHNTGQNPFFGANQMCCSVPCPGDCWPPCPDLCQIIGCTCDECPGGLPDFDVDAPEAWDIETGDPSVIVVVFDQGVQLDHPDLMIDPALGWDSTGQGGGGFPVQTCDWHGTTVAGVIRGQMDNEIGVAGLAPTASVASARVLSSTSTTYPCGTESDWFPSGVVESLVQAEMLDARITNHSYGVSPSGIVTMKLAQTRADGMLHFASTGNTGNASISYPARLASVLAVSAVERSGGLWSASSFGPGLDFAAPGEWVYSTDITGDASIGGFGPAICNDYAPGAGTSFASPIAAAVAALVISVDPTLTADGVEQIMRQSAIDLGLPGYDTQYGSGMVNAFNAVVLARNCLADFDDNGVVELSDLATLLAHFGGPGASEDGDMNGDGLVDLGDLALLLATFGTMCP